MLSGACKFLGWKLEEKVAKFKILHLVSLLLVKYFVGKNKNRNLQIGLGHSGN
jgi:hypothetical protein